MENHIFLAITIYCICSLWRLPPSAAHSLLPLPGSRSWSNHASKAKIPFFRFRRRFRACFFGIGVFRVLGVGALDLSFRELGRGRGFEL